MVARTLTVVQILPDMDEGGVEQGTLEIGRFLSRKGHRSLVVSRGGRLVRQLNSEGSRHIAMPYIGEKSPRCLLHLFALRRLLIQQKVDILHLRSRLPAWIGFGAWRSLPPAARPKLVTTFHGFYSINAYSGVMTRGERIIAVSKAIAAHIQSAYGVAPGKIETIYRGVDPEVFSPQHVSDQCVQRLRQKWGLAEAVQVPIILMPARVTRLKGHDLLIEALSNLRERPWRLICVGDFEPRADYYHHLKRMCRNLAMDSRVIFVGHCDDIAAAIRLSNLVVSTSTRPESFGRILVEAQAMGRPVIAPAHGGSLEIVEDGVTGWLFCPGDVDHLKKTLNQALTEEERWGEIGAHGRNHVLKYFTLSQMCQRTLMLYRSLLS